MVSHRPVAQILLERLPWSVFLVGSAVLLAALFGGTVGWLAAWRSGAAGPRTAMTATVGLGTLPEFLVAMVLIVVFTSKLGLFPSSGAITVFADAAPLRRTMDIIWHAVLPSLTLVLGLAPAFALLVRNAVTPVMSQPFLMAARAKGLPPKRIALHVFRNALPPVATLLGLRLGAAVAGAAVVERIFAYPGMGWLLYQSVAMRDYPVLQGVVFVSSLAILGMNTVLDVLAGRLDPRLAETT
jgi:peptide/nickel transport system permease protein